MNLVGSERKIIKEKKIDGEIPDWLWAREEREDTGAARRIKCVEKSVTGDNKNNNDDNNNNVTLWRYIIK